MGQQSWDSIPNSSAPVAPPKLDWNTIPNANPAEDITVNPPGQTSPAPSIPSVTMPNAKDMVISGAHKAFDWANNSIFGVKEPTPEEIQHEGMPAVVRKGVANLTTPFALAGEAVGGLGLLKGLKFLRGAGEAGEVAEELPKVKVPDSSVLQTAEDTPKPKYSTNRDGTISPKDNPLIRYKDGKLVGPQKIKLSNAGASLDWDKLPNETTIAPFTGNTETPTLPTNTKVNVNSGTMPNVKGPEANTILGPPKNNTPIIPPVIPPENQLGMGFGEDAPVDFKKVNNPEFDLEDNKFNWDKWNKKSVKDKIVDVLSSARSAQSVDFTSALLRQGAGLIHKKSFYTAIKPAFEAMASEGNYNKIAQSILDHPLFADANKNGVSFTGFKNIASREEQFQSPLAEHIIPKVFGNKVPNPIRAAARGYTTFMNKLRMDTYASLVDNAEQVNKTAADLGAEAIPINKPAIAKFINTTTGRGTFNSKTVEQAMPLINQAIYSPRLMKAHFDMLNPATYIKQANKGVRLEYLKSAIALAGLTGTTNMLLNYAGGESNDDMNSADFGKVKFGNTRLDPMAGNQQYMVLLHRLATNHVTNSTGKSEQLDTRFGGPTKLGTLANFVRNKLAPVPAAIVNTVAGKDGGGNPTNTSLTNNEVVKLYTPMIAQDFADLVKDNPKLLPLLIPGNFGMSLQTYSSPAGKTKGFNMPWVKF